MDSSNSGPLVIKAVFDPQDKILCDLNEERVFKTVLLEGRDGLSELFEYRVEASLETDWFQTNWRKAEPVLAKAQAGFLISKKVDGQVLERRIHGEIWDLAVLGGSKDSIRLRFRLRPALARLELAKSTRAWTETTTIAILKELIFGVYGDPDSFTQTQFIQFNSDLQRPLVLQYQETDLAFFLRLCSEHGLAFYHTTDEQCSRHSIRLTENTQFITAKIQKIHVNSGPNNNRAICLRTWKRQLKRSGNPIEIRDSSYRVYHQQVQLRELGFGRRDQDPHWEEDAFAQAGYLDTHQGKLEIHAVDKVLEGCLSNLKSARDGKILWVKSKGNAFHLNPGARFQPLMVGEDFLDPLANNGIPDEDSINGIPVNKTWIVTAQELDFFQDDTGSNLKCRFEFAPDHRHQLPWPPLPKPKIAGVLTARVVGGEENTTVLDGESVSADNHSGLGRVMIRLHCDRVKLHEGILPGHSIHPNHYDVKQTNSLPMRGYWARVAQTWAGKGYGAMFWPRVGNEVLVGFENGDPDRPVVLGSLYNSLNNPPYNLPSASLIQGWKTKCQGDTDGSLFNVIVLGDEKDDAGLVIRSSNAVYVANKGNRSTIEPSKFAAS